jgi:hypothetical protein
MNVGRGPYPVGQGNSPLALRNANSLYTWNSAIGCPYSPNCREEAFLDTHISRTVHRTRVTGT